ncbi:hypothetical protein BASA81_009293 [Batrachochytrium salamandrivorans]|nr:hypothetical protein BASA81_009293 [Batrachochytrium salamandrivorans]
MVDRLGGRSRQVHVLDQQQLQQQQLQQQQSMRRSFPTHLPSSPIQVSSSTSSSTSSASLSPSPQAQRPRLIPHSQSPQLHLSPKLRSDRLSSHRNSNPLIRTDSHSEIVSGTDSDSVSSNSSALVLSELSSGIDEDYVLNTADQHHSRHRSIQPFGQRLSRRGYASGSCHSQSGSESSTSSVQLQSPSMKPIVVSTGDAALPTAGAASTSQKKLIHVDASSTLPLNRRPPTKTPMVALKSGGVISSRGLAHSESNIQDERPAKRVHYTDEKGSHRLQRSDSRMKSTTNSSNLNYTTHNTDTDISSGDDCYNSSIAFESAPTQQIDKNRPLADQQSECAASPKSIQKQQHNGILHAKPTSTADLSQAYLMNASQPVMPAGIHRQARLRRTLEHRVNSDPQPLVQIPLPLITTSNQPRVLRPSVTITSLPKTIVTTNTDKQLGGVTKMQLQSETTNLTDKGQRLPFQDAIPTQQDLTSSPTAILSPSKYVIEKESRFGRRMRRPVSYLESDTFRLKFGLGLGTGSDDTTDHTPQVFPPLTRKRGRLDKHQDVVQTSWSSAYPEKTLSISSRSTRQLKKEARSLGGGVSHRVLRRSIVVSDENDDYGDTRSMAYTQSSLQRSKREARSCEGVLTVSDTDQSDHSKGMNGESGDANAHSDGHHDSVCNDSIAEEDTADQVLSGERVAQTKSRSGTHDDAQTTLSSVVLNKNASLHRSDDSDVGENELSGEQVPLNTTVVGGRALRIRKSHVSTYDERSSLDDTGRRGKGRFSRLEKIVNATQPRGRKKGSMASQIGNGNRNKRGSLARHHRSERGFHGLSNDTGSQNNGMYGRRLRKREPVDYTRQLMPPDLSQLLALDRPNESAIQGGVATTGLDADHEGGKSTWNYHASHLDLSQSNGAGRSRLNEDDDDATPVIAQGRIFALFSGVQNIRGSTVPLNMSDMLRAEEQNLMKGVDATTRKLIDSKKLSITQNAEFFDAGKVDFSMVAGFDEHIKSLKEMVGLPLMYPEIFEKFSIAPPRGVLFHGPPGTGKTLMARALAASCSTSNRPVAFFMRRGADVLSKWVGESERQLRILFEQARAWQPSMIFFDEIDGLAPVRSSKQDQIHSSVVSTLLALMDGLDNRGQVVVIGATNRLDSIDPALRRPGRFDRELYFGLPKAAARRQIIDIHIKSWLPPLDEGTKESLTHLTKGYSGADIKALCTEAALHAVRSSFPAIYDVGHKLEIRLDEIQVRPVDFYESMRKVVPSMERSATVYGRPLSLTLSILLRDAHAAMGRVICSISEILRHAHKQQPYSANSFDGSDHAGVSLQNGHGGQAVSAIQYLKAFEPRILVVGEDGMGQEAIGAAAIDMLQSEKYFIETVDATVLLSRSESIESSLIQSFRELKRHKPSVLYLPRIDSLWDIHGELDDLSVDIQSLFFAEIASHSNFGWKRIIHMKPPDSQARRIFFSHLLSEVDHPSIAYERDPALSPSQPSQFKHALAQVAESPAEILTEIQRLDLRREYDKHRLALRQHLMHIIQDLKKSFRVFAKPVDRELHPLYNPAIPMDLGTMEDKTMNDAYETIDAFMADIALIVANAEQFNDARVFAQKEILVKVIRLRDAAREHIGMIPRDIVRTSWYCYALLRSDMMKDPHRIDVDETVLPSVEIGRQELKGAENESLLDVDRVQPSGVTICMNATSPDTPHSNSGMSQLLAWLVSSTDGLTVTKLEDLGVALASVVISRHASNNNTSRSSGSSHDTVNELRTIAIHLLNVDQS